MTQSQSSTRKPIRNLAIAAFALLALSCMLHVVAAQECQFFNNFTWAALQLVRPAVLAAWTSTPAHPCPASTLLQHLLQIVAANWPLPHVLAG